MVLLFDSLLAQSNILGKGFPEFVRLFLYHLFLIFLE
ncbi:hypothetical protein NIES3806_25910 [Microcystis aeruginosa NIES-3806]|jgi:hypothetical protein|uniref:Uncharacterized protein n=2 Tax=Microcystis aeruginosa TaxID=1126 RepID=A0AAD3AYJ2_MICAE|nr:hypothetical protein MiTs_00440 [Microcystis aeruginosa NIES-2521]GCL55243.1 hypothetical protein NIES3806_25910 [Microcystis aeruginosa NIES-3806]GCL57988.1 hypothetical protein NIES3807_11510 [Microcystis aeruginosa NIES-3807]